jgi:tetratricopeptide (TPR) repeat protein
MPYETTGLPCFGITSRRLSCVSAAAVMYERALALAPRHSDALYNLGVACSQAAQTKHTMFPKFINSQAFHKALQPRLRKAALQCSCMLSLITIFPCRCSLSATAAMYERALALAPRHSDALYNLGVACSEAAQIERAMFCYELTTHFNPGCAEAWNNLGVLHKEQDNLERAAECYMAALNIRPNFPQV